MAAVLSSNPRMSQLESIWTEKERINLIRSIAPWWLKIGRSLHLDKSVLLDIRAHEASKGVEACCKSLFQRWLEGAGVQPASWRALLDALDRSHFYVLAQDIEKTLIMQNPCMFD